MEKAISTDVIVSRILIIRGRRVMLDKDLALLYRVGTKQLVRQVRRNIERFPEDFMFQLSKGEMENLKCQIGTSSWGGTRYIPLVFTEQGIAMLSGVLRSKRAVQVNIQIMRAFVQLRRMILTNADLRRKIEQIEKKYDKQFAIVFDAIKKLIEQPKVIEKRIRGFSAR